MNRAVVIRAAAGLTAYLKARPAGPVRGHRLRRPAQLRRLRARHGCGRRGRRGRRLRDAAARAHPGAGVRDPPPGRRRGVMVTASHNPPQDNGYKVYLGDGVADRAAGRRRDRRPRSRASTAVAEVPLADDGWHTLGPEVLDALPRRVVDVVAPDRPRDLVRRPHRAARCRQRHRSARLRAGRVRRAARRSRARREPDPRLPDGVVPEPRGAGRHRRGSRAGPRDGPRHRHRQRPRRRPVRRAPCPVDGGWRMLRGDEVGALLGAHILARGVDPDAVFANSIVSSRLLAAMARAAGIRHEETLTGFKWISRVRRGCATATRRRSATASTRHRCATRTA